MGGGPDGSALPRVRTRSREYAGLGFGIVCAALILGLCILTRDGELAGSVFASELWPAGGLPIVWLLVRGARVVSIDSLLMAGALYLVNLLVGAEPALAAVFAVSNVVQTWLAVALLRRWCPEVWGCGGSRGLDTPRTIARLGGTLFLALGIGAVVGVAASAAVPSLGLAFDPVDSLLWFGRNLGSALVVVPLAIMVGHRITSPGPRPSLRGPDAGPLELLAAALFTVVMYGLAFSLEELPLAFPLLAATVWFGARFTTLLSAAHSFVVGLATMALTLRGIGPFAAVEDIEVGFLIAQFYIATIAITGLAIATGRDERQALADALRRAQEEVSYEESVRAAVIGSMTEGVLVVDETGDLLVHNDAAARILGLGDQLSTQSRFSMTSWTIDGVEMTAAERPTARALRGERVEGELVVVRVANVGERVLTVSAIPLPHDDAHDRNRAMVLLRDSTSEHAHREELAAFAGVVAHDLRNPLAAIDGWTDMIADELDAGALDTQLTQEFVSRVRSSSRRMRELIRDLLAHATSSARNLDVRPIDVAALVSEVAAAQHADGLVSSEPVPAVLGDPVLVRQVLDNLIGNALKYVAPGEEPKVAVIGHRSDARLVTVEVHDNGIGVLEEDRQRIFEEFHRAHFQDYEGSGLGLSIVRRIVTRHGGTIEALPNPVGQGSVFRFTLPAYDD